MALDGLHHVTAITADAQANLDFYAGVLGLRLVKRTVNFDAPDVYHLYYGDAAGSPGSVLTFFEFPGAVRGRAGDGMAHTIAWRVAGEAALDFWAGRLEGEGIATERRPGALAFRDPEGLRHELRASTAPDAPLTAPSGAVPAEHALQGLDGVRAYARAPERSAALLTRLGFARDATRGWELRGEHRRAAWGYDAATGARGRPGAGTVHHVAWCCPDAELETWRDDLRAAGLAPTDVIDRTYFRSVYFVEPSGVLFELATPSPGFTVDEPAEDLGRALRLPPAHQHLRARLERTLTPLLVPGG